MTAVRFHCGRGSTLRAGKERPGRCPTAGPKPAEALTLQERWRFSSLLLPTCGHFNTLENRLEQRQSRDIRVGRKPDGRAEALTLQKRRRFSSLLLPACGHFNTPETDLNKGSPGIFAS